MHLVIYYHEGTPKSDFTDGRIVRAHVQLASCDRFPCSDSSKPMKIPKPKDMGKKLTIPYTYTVKFEVGLAHLSSPPP